MASFSTEHILEEEDAVKSVLEELSEVTLETCPSISTKCDVVPELLQRLQKHEAHFSWDLKKANPGLTMEELIDDMDRKDEEGFQGDYQEHWRDFNFAALRAFCYADMKKMEQANQSVAYAKLLTKEDDLQHVHEGLLYVCDVMQAYLYALLDQSDKANEALDSIPEYHSLSHVARATVQGLRAAALIEMHDRGNELALPFLEQALELDNSYPEWFYMRAKAAAHVRKIKNPFSVCDDREILDLQEAIKLRPKPIYQLSLAEKLAGKAKGLLHMKRNGHYNSVRYEEIAELNKQAKELFCLVLKEKPNCTRVNVDCAEAFLKLPHPHRSYDLAESCIKKALELAPTSSKVHHRAATIYEYKPNATPDDYSTAIKYYEKAVALRAENGPATLGLVKLKILVEPEYDPLLLLAQMKQNTRIRLPEQMSAEVLKGFFFWTKFSDAKKAAQAWCQALQIGNDLFKDQFMKTAHNRCFKQALKEPGRLQSALREIIDNETDTITKEYLMQILAVLQDTVDSHNEQSKGTNKHDTTQRYTSRQPDNWRRRSGWDRKTYRGAPSGRGKK